MMILNLRHGKFDFPPNDSDRSASRAFLSLKFIPTMDLVLTNSSYSPRTQESDSIFVHFITKAIN